MAATTALGWCSQQLRSRIANKSTLSILIGSCTLFAGFELLSDNERFHREVAIPLVHRLLDGERAHTLGVKFAAAYAGLLLVGRESRREYAELRCVLFDRELTNPIGLAAGFDKNGEAIDGLLHRAGFGLVEVGTVTPCAQPGNVQRPRIWRLPRCAALINVYGFNSDGAQAVLGRVKKVFNKRKHAAPSAPLLGVNLGKNAESRDAIADYVLGVRTFGAHCDYLVVNVSSPNTAGLRALQARSELEQLLRTLHVTLRQTAAVDAAAGPTKLVLKIAPDLSVEEMRDIAAVCTNPMYGVDALIVANTTTQRPAELLGAVAGEQLPVGGLSGAPLRAMSTHCVFELYRLTQGKVPIIGCGGIASGADAYEKIRAGASAVQLYTALVYQGFPVVGRVKRELAELLHHDGFQCVADAVGAAHQEKK